MSGRIIGIDVGILGAVAVLDGLGKIVECADLPVAGDGARRMVSAPLLADLIRRYQSSSAVIERVSSRPGEGVSSAFRFGRACGVAEGVIGALGLPIIFVAPNVWKRHHGLLSRGKDSSRGLALQIWPESAAYFARVKDGHRAESCLIAVWGLRAEAAST